MILSLSSSISAQEVPIEATVCAILTNPLAYDGKMIRVRAPVVAAWNEFEIIGGECNQDRHAIWLRIPPEKSPEASNLPITRAEGIENPSVAADLRMRQENLRRFRRLLMARIPAKGKSGTCLSCYRYDVTATFVGKLEMVESSSRKPPDSQEALRSSGYGHDGSYRLQFVIHSVSDISAQDRTSKYK
jgi:hypothetical protein